MLPVLLSFHGMARRGEHASFELVAEHGSVAAHLSVPDRIAGPVSAQLIAHNPGLALTPIEDDACRASFVAAVTLEKTELLMLRTGEDG